MGLDLSWRRIKAILWPQKLTAAELEAFDESAREKFRVELQAAYDAAFARYYAEHAEEIGSYKDATD